MRLLLVSISLLALAGCTERPKPASVADTATVSADVPVAGQWRGELPAADAESRRFTLTLTEDYSALLRTEYVGKGVTTEKGTWSADGRAVTVMLEDQDGKPISTFLGYDLVGRTLVPVVGWDSTLWGSHGPPRLEKR